MITLRLDAASICLAHNFIKGPDCDYTDLSFVVVENSCSGAVRMSALDGHKIISFYLRESNPEQRSFLSFGFRISSDILKKIKPKTNKSYPVILHIPNSDTCKETEIEIEANGVLYPAMITESRIDVSALWRMIRSNFSDQVIFLPSVLPIKDIASFDFSKFFSHATHPAFIKKDKVTIVNFQGLPEGIDARGAIMQMTPGCNPYFYNETYGEDLPVWC